MLTAAPVAARVATTIGGGGVSTILGIGAATGVARLRKAGGAGAPLGAERAEGLGL